jgi:hypothetical protein
MPDQKFWEVYFALAASHLPAIACTWKDGDPLPSVSGTKEGDEDTFMSVTGLQGHLKTIGTKIQAAATAATKGKVGAAGVELTSLLPLGVVGGTSDGSTSAPPEAGGTPEGTGSSTARSGALLETDPDLEAYLQTADEERGDNGAGDDNSSRGEKHVDADGVENDDDDLDLDQYLNELSAEVGEAEGEEGAENGGGGSDENEDDVEAVLRALQDEI